jgi:Serine dehydrogenase proteinase
MDAGGGNLSAIGDIQFPRTAKLPCQSPLYWVNQKDRYLRQLMIRDIEAITGRRLVVYFANRFLVGSEIDDADPALIAELLSDLPDGESVDFMIETNGGKTDSTEAIVSILRNRLKDFRVIVANAAKSNGTLICLAASSIVMGPTSELGPIDPHVQGTPCTILALPDMAAMNFPLHHMAILFLKQTQKLAETLLRAGMMNGTAAGEVERVVQALSSRDTYFSHGSTIDVQEAKQLGLNVESLSADNEVWQRIWLLYSMYDYDSRRDGMLKIFEGRGRSTSVKGAPITNGQA